MRCLSLYHQRLYLHKVIGSVLATISRSSCWTPAGNPMVFAQPFLTLLLRLIFLSLEVLRMEIQRTSNNQFRDRL